MCITIYIFSFYKQKTKKQNKKTKTTTETKEENRISMKNLTRYNDIVCKFALCTVNLIELQISPSCSYEFNAVYVQQKKSQYLLYYNKYT